MYYVHVNSDNNQVTKGSMKISQRKGMFKEGNYISYNDGRAGHEGVLALILSVDAIGMTVQFEDRADTTAIKFSDRAWMDYITFPTISALVFGAQ